MRKKIEELLLATLWALIVAIAVYFWWNSAFDYQITFYQALTLRLVARLLVEPHRINGTEY